MRTFIASNRCQFSLTQSVPLRASLQSITRIASKYHSKSLPISVKCTFCLNSLLLRSCLALEASYSLHTLSDTQFSRSMPISTLKIISQVGFTRTWASLKKTIALILVRICRPRGLAPKLAVQSKSQIIKKLAKMPVQIRRLSYKTLLVIRFRLYHRKTALTSLMKISKEVKEACWNCAIGKVQTCSTLSSAAVLCLVADQTNKDELFALESNS